MASSMRLLRPSHQTAAAGEQDVVAELLLEFGVEAADQLLDAFDDRRDEDLAGLLAFPG